MKNHFFFKIALASLALCSCIMSKNPQYQPLQDTSYLKDRYEEIMYVAALQKLTSADIDEAYLLSTMYIEKKQFNEAKNLLNLVFYEKKTLQSGLAYAAVLEQLNEKKEAQKVQKILTVLYPENEVENQKRIANDL